MCLNVDFLETAHSLSLNLGLAPSLLCSKDSFLSRISLFKVEKKRALSLLHVIISLKIFFSILCHDGISTFHITLDQNQNIPIIKTID